MKIDAQSMILTGKLTCLEPDQTSYFACLLDDTNKKHKSDDYYWQHQNQLQRSDLTFNSVESQSKSQMISPKNQTIAHQVQTVGSAQCALEFISVNDFLNRGSSKSTTTSELEIKQLSSAIEIFLESPTDHSDVKMVDEEISQNNRYQKLMRNQTSLPSATFKNYQLFLNNNQIELTLNTTHFSKQQSNELQKSIKQWLTNKGYSLKQLIINGVAQ